MRDLHSLKKSMRNFDTFQATLVVTNMPEWTVNVVVQNALKRHFFMLRDHGVCDLWPLIRFNFNPSMDKQSHAQ